MQRSTRSLQPLCRQLSQLHTVRTLPAAVLPAGTTHLTRSHANVSRRITSSSRVHPTISFAPVRSLATVADGSSSSKKDADGADPFALPRAFLVNTATIPGYEISEVIGLVSGNTVRVRNIVRDYFAGLRSIFGGELTTYTDLMMEAREEATERMVSEAVELGANAIVNIRVETSALAANSSEMYCYGTAVVVKLADPNDRQSRRPNDGGMQPSANE